MKILYYTFPAQYLPQRRAHVGVVASGDLEILLDNNSTLIEQHEDTDQHAQVEYPHNADELCARVRICTSVDGYDATWKVVLERFFAHTPLAGYWELNDCGATPGVVALRLHQAARRATEELITTSDGHHE